MIETPFPARGCVQNWQQVRCAFDRIAMCAKAFSIFDEIGIAEIDVSMVP